MKQVYVEGYIELDGNKHSRVKFNIDTEQDFWNQWGNTNEKMFKTVDIVEKMKQAVNNSVESNVEIIGTIGDK